jgi:eukaryotic-like serine/threonine-protein kinase
VELLKSLQHPNIARCFGGLLEESHGCIVSELVEGETLASVLSRRGRLSWEGVDDYASQVSSALEHAHAAGVVHQDLTPEKILITPEDQVKLIDFRCDRAANATCSSSQRRTLARARYQSPEQLRGETKLTHKSDLYSLGCIMFEILVGQTPFEAETVAELQRRQAEEKAPRVDSLVLDCPVWLDSLIGQMLDPDPLRRPYSAQAVTLALRETHKKVAAQTSVLEHAAGGFSTIQRTADQNIARDLLQSARREVLQKKKRAEEPAPFWERPWFLAACLITLLGSLAGYVLWPVSEDSLIRHARTLMASQDEMQWERARDYYLEPLLEKFPEGEHVVEARTFIDQIDMARAEKRLKLNQRFRREPSSEGEQLYAEALNFEQFGDRFTALEKYDSMVHLLQDKPKDRPYMNLALRQKAAIEKAGGSGDRAKFIEDRLQYADKLEAEGKTIEARDVWKSILKLYGDKREFAAFVARADERLDPRGSSRPPDPGEPSADAEATSEANAEPSAGAR